MPDPAVSPATHASPNLHKYSSGNRFYDWHLRAFMQRIHALIQQGAPETVLDAGCGEGFAIDFLKKEDPSIQYTGVDLSEEAISYAQAHFSDQARFRNGSIYKLPFSDNSFDLVLCSEVLEHLDDPNRAVDELRRVARSHIVITVPREPYFKWLNDIGRALGVSPDPGHVNFWTKRSFQDFVEMHFGEATFEWKHIFQLALVDLT